MPLSEIKKNKNSLLKDNFNKSVFDYRFVNLVYGVDDKDSLIKQIKKIENNRRLAVKFTYDKYKSLFRTDYSRINKVIKLITKWNNEK